MGKRAYCVGSNYIWAWENNRILREALSARGGTVVAERYTAVGDTDLSTGHCRDPRGKAGLRLQHADRHQRLHTSSGLPRRLQATRHRPAVGDAGGELQPLRAGTGEIGAAGHGRPHLVQCLLSRPSRRPPTGALRRLPRGGGRKLGGLGGCGSLLRRGQDACRGNCGRGLRRCRGGAQGASQRDGSMRRRVRSDRRADQPRFPDAAHRQSNVRPASSKSCGRPTIPSSPTPIWYRPRPAMRSRPQLYRS